MRVRATSFNVSSLEVGLSTPAKAHVLPHGYPVFLLFLPPILCASCSLVLDMVNSYSSIKALVPIHPLPI